MSVTSLVDLLATAEKLPEEEYINLKLASIFLITGYIYDYEEPLEGVFNLMKETLPRFGFDENNILAARQLITNSFSGKHESVCGKILHDAKYDYLGRVDYIRLTEKLLKERNEHGIKASNDSWVAIQKGLLKDQDFVTKTGKLLRSVSIGEQISALQEMYK